MVMLTFSQTFVKKKSFSKRPFTEIFAVHEFHGALPGGPGTTSGAGEKAGPSGAERGARPPSRGERRR